MSIVFVLILISALSSYIIIVNEQVAHSYDIVVQIEKNFKSFYETEFVIYYILDFYQNNYEEVPLPSVKRFDLYFSPVRKKITADVKFKQSADDIAILITINSAETFNRQTLVSCHLFRDINGQIKFKNYQIEKHRHAI